MVIRPVHSSRTRRRRGALVTEVVVAMGLFTVAMLPLAYSVAREQKLTRACYNRAVVMEILDGEMEALLAGERRAFQPGAQTYPVRAEAAKSLPPGRFVLTLEGDRLRLEWLPAKSGQGGKVAREAGLAPLTPGTAGDRSK